MNIHFAPAKPDRRVKIKVVGVGGAGGNAVNRMIEEGLTEVDFYAINTDSQALEASQAHQTLVIGNRLTRGLGAGGNPEVGRQAAEEDRELLAAMVEDTDMVFVTAGMGGGTGTGAAPLVAAAARASGALTVAVVTRPFEFEGRRRMAQAEAGLAALREQVDALLVIPNERLMEIDVADGGMTSVFKLADSVLYEATRGICDIIAQQAVVNLDFADVRTVMQDSGAAIMGTGRASGEHRARIAADQAIRSPLLENVDIHGSRAVLVYLTAASVDRDDLRQAMGHIQAAAGEEAHIFFGFANTDGLGEDLQVTVIATGFPLAEGTGHAPRALPASVAEVVAEDPAPLEPMLDLQEIPTSEEPAEAVLTAVEADQAPAAPGPHAEDPELRRAVNDVPAPIVDHDVVFQPDSSSTETHGGDRDLDDPETEQGTIPVLDPVIIEAVNEAVIEEVAEAVTEVAVEAASTQRREALQQLSALAAAAGGQARVQPVGEAPVRAPDTARRFLEPLGSVKIGEQATEQRPAAPRFRSTVLDDDKLRPAWERKYVD